MSKFKQAITNIPQFLARTKLIYDAEAIFSAREALRQKLTGAPFSEIEFHKMLTKELALVKDSDIVFAVNAAEAEIFRRSANADVHVLGHAVRSEPELTAFRDRCDILFVGPLDDDVSPNVDSLVWFVREIMPLLELHLGSRLPAKRRRSKRIKCGEGLGRSTRLFPRRRPGSHAILRARPYLHRADALCGGSADEVHEAAAAGLPVVATTLLSKQLDWSHGNELLAADTAGVRLGLLSPIFGCLDLASPADKRAQPREAGLRSRRILAARRLCAQELTFRVSTVEAWCGFGVNTVAELE